jgi:hypothetical protein
MRTPRSPFVVSPRITPDDFKSQRRLSAIGHELVRDLERDYRAHGVKATEDLRKNEPWNYLRLLLSLVPPQAPSAEDWFNQLSDEELDTLIHVARSALAEQREAGGMPTGHVVSQTLPLNDSDLAISG